MNIQSLRAKRAIIGNSSTISNRKGIADLEGTECGAKHRTPPFGSAPLLTAGQARSAIILSYVNFSY
jgi:hypothetical protein